VGTPRPVRCAPPRVVRPSIHGTTAGIRIPGTCAYFAGRKPRLLVTVAQHNAKVRGEFRMLRRRLGIEVIPPGAAGAMPWEVYSTREELAPDGDAFLPVAVYGDALPGGHYPAATYDVYGTIEALAELLGMPFVTGWSYALTEAHEPRAAGGGEDKPKGKGKPGKGSPGRTLTEKEWEYRDRTPGEVACVRAAHAAQLEIR
jgi:hypothetical protein